MRDIIGSSDAWYRGAMKKRGLPVDIDPESYLRWREEKLGLE